MPKPGPGISERVFPMIGRDPVIQAMTCCFPDCACACAGPVAGAELDLAARHMDADEGNLKECLYC